MDRLVDLAAQEPKLEVSQEINQGSKGTISPAFILSFLVTNDEELKAYFTCLFLGYLNLIGVIQRRVKRQMLLRVLKII